jgi:outer membrane protein
MMRFSRIAAVAVSILGSMVLSAATAVAAVPTLQPAVIAIVDMDRVVNGCTAGKQAQVELKVKVEAIQAKAATLKSQFATEEEALVKVQPAATNTAERPAWETKVRDFQTRRQAADADLTQQDKDLQAIRLNLLKQITAAAQPIITAVMRETGATIVLAEGATLQHTASIDITNEVVTRLDKTLPSVSVTAPAAP